LALELVGKLAVLRTRKPGWRLTKLLEQVKYRLIEIRDGVIEDVLQIKGQPRLTTTFSLSYEALDSDQQRLFRALGIFAHASFAFEHVAAVLGWDGQKTENELDALVAQSLVQWNRNKQVAGNDERDEEQNPRYTLHSLLHGYAAAQMEIAGEYPTICSAYTAHYLTYASNHRDPKADDYTLLEAMPLS